MGVSTFTQPDAGSQTGSAYKAAIDGAISVLKRISQSFAPHEQSTPNMTVRLDAGWVFSGVTLTEKAAQSTGTITAPSTDPRIDRVVVSDTNGVVSVITGVEAASPVPPAITAGKLPICQIALVVSQTSIINSDLTDERAQAAAAGGIFGGTGADGTVTISANTTINGIKNYVALTINAGITLDHDNERALTIKVQGTLTINGTISGNGKGYIGGAARGAASNLPGIAGSTGGIPGGGGGGGLSQIGGKGGSSYLDLGAGGGGAFASVGGAGVKPLVYQDLIAWSGQPAIAGGGGGGSGGTGAAGDASGKGGRGAGVIIIEADTIVIASGGILRANGDAGDNGGVNAGGGGGGAGGIIILRYKTLTETGTIEANGGAGGTSGTNAGDGGAGSAGLIIREALP